MISFSQNQTAEPRREHPVQLTEALRSTFAAALLQYPMIAAQEIGHGPSHEVADGAFRREEITLKLLFTEKFERVSSLCVQQEIRAIKQAPAIDPERLHFFLIHKYLGISEKDFRANRLSGLSTTPYAFRAFPEEGALDASLQNYFRRPFYLFSIMPHYPDPTRWLWNEYLDSAPLFRRFIQLYLIAEMQEDVHQQNAFGAPLSAYASSLQRLFDICFSDFRFQLDTLLKEKVYHSSPRIVGSIEPDRVPLEQNLPGLTRMAIAYPFGRWLFGQSFLSLPHLYAKHPFYETSKKYIPYYLFFWLAFHLHLATSLYWGKCLFLFAKHSASTFADYVAHGNHPIHFAIRGGTFTLFFLVLLFFSPLFILTPCLYGLTSIPFNFLRTLWLHAPFCGFLRRRAEFTTPFLVGIDALAIVKDFFLLMMSGALYLSLVGPLLLLRMPLSLLRIHFYTGILFIFFLGHATAFLALFLHLDVGVLLLYFFFPASPLAIIALSVIEELLFVCMISLFGGCALLSSLYIATGFSMRMLKPLFSLFSAIGAPVHEKINALLNYFFPPEVPLNPPILLRSFEGLLDALHALQDSFHLSKERKQLFQEASQALRQSTADTLPLARDRAERLLESNFTKEETDKMLTLIALLQKETMGPSERMVLLREEQGIRNNRASEISIPYQPSWALTKALQEKGLLGTSNRLPDTAKQKCLHILTLKTTSAFS